LFNKLLQFLHLGHSSAPTPAARRRRGRAGAARTLPAEIELLERRRLLAGSFAIAGASDTFRFTDADGDVVDFKVLGTQGRLDLFENTTDGIGNDDGILEDGEVLGAMSLRSPSADFQVRVEHRSDVGRGDGIVDLGHFDGGRYRISGLVGIDGTEGASTFRLASLRIGELAPQGSVRVDEIGADGNGAGLVVEEMSRQTTVRIDGSVWGRLVVGGDLYGTITVGGSLERGVVVGGNLYGNARIDVGGTIREQLLVVGFHGGDVTARDLAGDVKVLGHVLGNSRITVGQTFTGDAEFVRALHGEVFVGGDWHGNLTIGGQFGELGSIRSGGNVVGDARVYGAFYGDVRVGGRTYGNWDAHDEVMESATIVAGTHFLAFRARRDFGGQFLALGSAVLQVDGNVEAVARIGSSDSAFTSVRAEGQFEGLVYGATSVYVGVGTIVRTGARLNSDERLVVRYGNVIENPLLRSPFLDLLKSTFPSTEDVTFLRGNGPIVIRESGRYVLAEDVVLASSDGIAIRITANDVTLDLAGRRIVGTAGSGSGASAVVGTGDGITVRNGSIAGFYEGVRLLGNRNTVEFVRAENIGYLGLVLDGADGRIVHNEIVDHGGSSRPAPYTVAIAIKALGPRMTVNDNVLSGTRRANVVEQVGIHVDDGVATRVERNVLRIDDVVNTYAIWVNGGSATRGITSATLVGNVVANAQSSFYLDVIAVGTSGLLQDNLMTNVRIPLRNSSGTSGGQHDLGGNLEVP
jgi:hypothetical protein